MNMDKIRQASSIDDKIVKAQENVERSKAKYDVAVAELKQLLAKKDAMKKDELMNAIIRSKKSYDEILEFLKSPQK